MDPFATHQRLLVKYLMQTEGAILELGCGNYSTPLIHEIANAQGRAVLTLDSQQLWLSQFTHMRSESHRFQYVPNWGDWKTSEQYGLAFIDHAPAERRMPEIRKLLDRVDVFVMHDTEDPAYNYDKVHFIMDHIETDTRSSPWTTASRGRIPMFPLLELETCSSCNRVCPTCIRNSHPDREAVSSWFSKKIMPIEVIQECVKQAAELDFNGNVCLSHYNEPLLDERLPKIVDIVKAALPDCHVFFHSNGDRLTPEIASSLDGVIDRIVWSVYIDNSEDRVLREKWLAGHFHETKMEFTGGGHIVTHFSPRGEAANPMLPCDLPRQRMALNHKGQMLLCCEDLVGNFNLGRFPQNTLKELWWSDSHQKYVRDLAFRGGRESHPYCISCPR
jgi:hypothetical protein